MCSYGAEKYVGLFLLQIIRSYRARFMIYHLDTKSVAPTELDYDVCPLYNKNVVPMGLIHLML
jgi:hypothetical protein